MKKLEKNSVVVIGNNEVKISEILPRVISLPARSILNYFKTLGLMFPRSLRVDALKEVISPYVYNEKPHVTPLSDELLYRLRWFETFSETQLVNLLPVFEDGILFDEYKETLWLNILEYMLKKQVSSENFETLFRITKGLEKVPPLERLEEKKYNDVLNSLFFDYDNCIDGLTTEIFRPVVYKCSTLGEVREIGKKYGVNVPRRLRKKELVEIILEEITDRGELTPELETEIQNMTVIPLQRFAKNNNIKVSIELKKEEIIEYILKNAQQTKGTYFKPQADSYQIYDQSDYKIPDIKEVEIEIEPEPEPAPEPQFVTVTMVFDDTETVFEIVKGEKVQQPTDPIKEGYEFSGWYQGAELFNFNDIVEADLRLDAKFVYLGPEMVTVSFIVKGEETKVEIEKGQLVKEPQNPEKEGYEFIGWFLEDDLYDFEDAVFEDIKLVAKWYELEIEMVTITFLDDEKVSNIEIVKGEKVEPIVPEDKENYEFVGWHLDEELYDFDLEVIEDIILVAEWKEIVVPLKPEVEKIYVSAESQKMDFSEPIDEMKKISKLVEELKDAVYYANKERATKVEGEIDFSYKYGFEKAFEPKIQIKEPVILSPYQAKVSKSSFKKLIKRKNAKVRKVKQTKKQKKAVPVIIVTEPEEDEY